VLSSFFSIHHTDASESLTSPWPASSVTSLGYKSLAIT
jgi:hypothetical protein